MPETHTAMPRTWNFPTFEREISDMYFPVSTVTQDEDRFRARVDSWTIGSVGITRMTSSPMSHSRRSEHLRQDNGSYLIVSMTDSTPLRFRQGRTDLEIGAGNFLIQLSDQPYEYIQCAAGLVWSVKIPMRDIRQFLPRPERYGSYAFDTRRGMGRVFYDLVTAAPGRGTELNGTGADDLSRILLEVLALTLENDIRVLGSGQCRARQALLARIERHIRSNLGDPSLSVETIAQAAGISTRYLHLLFRENGQSVARWVLEQRLAASARDLQRSSRGETVAEIGFRWGFRNAAHFSRAFRKHFGETPGAMQRRVTTN